MATEYLFDFGKEKIKLCLVTANSWYDLGPGKQWVPEYVGIHPVAIHPILKASKFKPISTRDANSVSVDDSKNNTKVTPIEKADESTGEDNTIVEMMPKNTEPPEQPEATSNQPPPRVVRSRS